MRRVFREVANDSRYRDWTVEEQHAQACDLAVENGVVTKDQLPSVDWAYKFLRPFRNYEHWLDDPWSMATLTRSDFDMSPESLPYVLPMWRRCFAGGLRLTNREMLWASKLYAMCAKRGMRSLHRWATTYATLHRTAEIRGEQLDTAPHDAQIAGASYSGFSLAGDSGERSDPAPWLTEFPSAIEPKVEGTLIQCLFALERVDPERRYRVEGVDGDPQVTFESLLYPMVAPEIVPLVRLSNEEARSRDWHPPTERHRELLILGLRAFAQADPIWRDVPGNEAQCREKVNSLIDILDDFDGSTTGDEREHPVNPADVTGEDHEHTPTIEQQLAQLSGRSNEFLEAVGLKPAPRIELNLARRAQHGSET